MNMAVFKIYVDFSNIWEKSVLYRIDCIPEDEPLKKSKIKTAYSTYIECLKINQNKSIGWKIKNCNKLKNIDGKINEALQKSRYLIIYSYC